MGWVVRCFAFDGPGKDRSRNEMMIFTFVDLSMSSTSRT